MPPSEPRRDRGGADVCLVVEGTYPYTPGGVSSWIHALVQGLPAVRFVVAHIGAEAGVEVEPRYTPPPNLIGVVDLHCRAARAQGTDVAVLRRAARTARSRHARARCPSRVLAALGRMLFLEDEVDDALLSDLAAGDLTVGEFLHGQAAFDLTLEVCNRLAPGASFLHFFWHFRSMHLPLVRLLAATPPPAAVYHAVCTGYAGALAAVWSRRTGRPLLLTEHGIYTRERNLELSRSLWLREPASSASGESEPDDATAAALRTVWLRHFAALARTAYARASHIVSLSETGRSRQIADGAAPAKTLVVPNGVDTARLGGMAVRHRPRPGRNGSVRVGFVGRVVPIKDVVTFIRACDLALREAGLDVRIVGPLDEDPLYAQRCRRLVADLGRARTIRFEGPQPIESIYAALDLLVLTSFSEGQPLVILEAGAAGIPVVATDVGACREMIEGRGEGDRRLGPSGVVTRMADPGATAAAILVLARDPDLRRRMGSAGQRRVAAFYRREDCFARYASLYAEEPWPASAGASSA